MYTENDPMLHLAENEGKRKVLPVPSKETIATACAEWERTEPFSSYENAMVKLFAVLPGNRDIADVLPKVAVINEFCALNIRAVLKVAEHIVRQDIDERLGKGDPSLCDALSWVMMPNGREYNFYSFATKYLSHSGPDAYPEYDMYVAKVLAYYRDTDDFTRFLMKELKDYPRFCRVIETFRRHYGLEDVSLPDIHKFLWLSGRKYFSERKEEER